MGLASSDLITGQWSEARRLKAHVDVFIRMMDDGPLAALDEIERMRSIDDAEGIWLERIGDILGLPRPYTSDSSMDLRFGFNAAGGPFDFVPYRGLAANDVIFPLPDGTYRRLLKARAVTVLTRGTLAEFERAVKVIDPGAVIVDNYNYTVDVTCTPSLLQLVQLADTVQALPRTAGVRVTYA